MSTVAGGGQAGRSGRPSAEAARRGSWRDRQDQRVGTCQRCDGRTWDGHCPTCGPIQHVSGTDIDRDNELYRATCVCGWRSPWVSWGDYDGCRRAWWRHTGKGPAT